MIKILSVLALLAATPALAGSIDIDSRNHRLTYHDGAGFDKTYPIAVGRQGTNVHGIFTVENKKMHPSWTPTPNMLHGRHSYTVGPGPRNPLGVAKIYLSGPAKYIGIHGTNDESSIGKNASHGCFRMHKQDILELYNNVSVGNTVVVR